MSSDQPQNIYRLLSTVVGFWTVLCWGSPIAYTISIYPNDSFIPFSCVIMWEINPNPGTEGMCPVSSPKLRQLRQEGCDFAQVGMSGECHRIDALADPDAESLWHIGKSSLPPNLLILTPMFPGISKYCNCGVIGLTSGPIILWKKQWQYSIHQPLEDSKRPKLEAYRLIVGHHV